MNRLGINDRINYVCIDYDPPNKDPTWETSNLSDLTENNYHVFYNKIQDLFESGHLQESRPIWSSYAYPFYKKGKPEIGVQYRNLNRSITYSGPFRSEVPNMEDILGSITESDIFSKIVVKDAFHQISLDEQSAEVMAFAVGKEYAFRVAFKRIKKLKFTN